MRLRTNKVEGPQNGCSAPNRCAGDHSCWESGNVLELSSSMRELRAELIK